ACVRGGRAETSPATVEHDGGRLALRLQELVAHRPEAGGVSPTFLLAEPGLDLDRHATHEEVSCAPPAGPLGQGVHIVTFGNQLRSHRELRMGETASGFVETPTRPFVVMATRQHSGCTRPPCRCRHGAPAPFGVPAANARSRYWRSWTSRTGQAGPRWIRWAI